MGKNGDLQEGAAEYENAEPNHIDVIKSKDGSDPDAVIFDGNDGAGLGQGQQQAMAVATDQGHQRILAASDKTDRRLGTRQPADSDRPRTKLTAYRGGGPWTGTMAGRGRPQTRSTANHGWAASIGRGRRYIMVGPQTKPMSGRGQA